MNIRTQSSRWIKALLCAGIIATGCVQAGAIQSVHAEPHTLKVTSSKDITSVAPEKLRQFTSHIIQELAKTAPFQSWAKPHSVIIEPLGPGTHSWLVTIHNESSESAADSGYMIISITPEGEYKLVEYGLGADSLFSNGILEYGLADLGISSSSLDNELPSVMKSYSGPILAEWIVQHQNQPQTVYYLDALTGEQLPERDNSTSSQETSYTPPRTAVGNLGADMNAAATVHITNAFDPYDNILWMTEPALQLSHHTFKASLDTWKRLVYVVADPNRSYSFPIPIFGYQTWNSSAPSSNTENTIYVLTGSDTAPRWIALDSLLTADIGKFIVYPDPK